jgi:hypothetical protein
MENLDKINYLGAQNNRLTPAGIKNLFSNNNVLPQIIDLSNN